MMMTSSHFSIREYFDFSITIVILLIISFTSRTRAQLSEDFYSETCSNLTEIVKSFVEDAVATEPRMGASLLRLHFHDCFTNGCDASVLLDVPGGEKDSVHNANSLRGFEVIDMIKESVESACPSQIVSCADILALTAREAVAALDGPTWTVLLGRSDSTTAASPDEAHNGLPFGTDDLSDLITLFASKDFTLKEIVALSGAHTIGQARCIRFRGRIYQEQNIDSSYALSMQSICPDTNGNGDDKLGSLDTLSPTSFNNDYYSNLVALKGLLHSDQVLFNNGDADTLVQLYATDETTFFSDFAAAMVKIGNLGAGSEGVVRTNCRVAG